MASLRPHSSSRLCVSQWGFILSWSLIILMAAVCVRVRADVLRLNYGAPRGQVLPRPETVTSGTADQSVYDEMTSDSMESSGHGPNAVDDDVEGEDKLQEDLYDSFGGGDEKGGGEWPPPHGEGRGVYIGPEQEKITCFRCHGDGVKGCDVLDMLNDVDGFSSKCVGKCMNISSGTTAAYDCAHDMTHSTDTCLNKGGTEICFCTGDFCNGPADLKRFYDKEKETYWLPSQRPLWNGTAGDNNGEDYDDLFDAHDNETEITTDRTIFTSRGNHSSSLEESNKAHGSSPLLDVIDRATNEIRKDHRGKSRIFDLHQADNLFSEHSEATKKHRGSPGAVREQIDVVIPAEIGEDNSTERRDMTTPYPLDINELSVGKLKDSSARSGNNGGVTTGCNVWIILLLNFCVLPYL
ncbi:unnamed protein product [Lymnaea stagnalis]|uniref:Uncharacterized protein n=1 Tax=Lymnaea stagnalis TaxID=6523 RepID=A0AAV2IFL0_LYMST